MLELLNRLLDSLAAGRAVAYCRLVETRGSTPQKAGAAMLVFADGSQAGTLGGGCVEAEVKRRALAVLECGTPEVRSFQLDSDYGWDDGLICGGRMLVLVEPIASMAEAEYFSLFRDLLARGAACTEAIAFDEKSGFTVPSCYLLDGRGACVTSRHTAEAAGNTPETILRALADLPQPPRPQAVAGVAYLPNRARSRLLIVGGGHVGQAVGQIAPDLDFDVWVVDDRAEYVARERFPRAERLIHGDIGPTLAALGITPETYCLIVTRGHNHDEEALSHLVERGARYVGMIGSRRKIRLIFDDLEAQGVAAESLARVYAPVGIDIGSQTVAEIAISIVAELVAHRNCGGNVPGRPAALTTVDS